MMKWILGALTIFFFITSSSADEHHCIHDTPELQDLFKSDMKMMNIGATAEGEAAKGREMQILATVDNIRIAVSTKDLDDPLKHCTTVGQTRIDFKGSTVVCEEADILTPAKKEILLTKVLPRALIEIKNRLKVTPVTTPMMVPDGACTHFTVPPEHISTGVANTDYILYVAAGPTRGGTIAWAGACALDSATKRPTIGRANFGPSFISWDDNKPTSQRDQIVTAVHELMHALGFSSGNFQKVLTTRRGKTVTIMNSPKVQEKARTFFNCPTIEGIELEDEGGAGSAGSHFDRRIVKDEIMTASSGSIISEFVLAAFDDFGFYTIDYSTAEPYTFAKNAGCGYHTQKCDTSGGGRGAYWCFGDVGEPSEACTDNNRGIGACQIKTYGSNLPSHFQYFTEGNKGGSVFVDFCPFVGTYSNRHCEDTVLVEGEDQTVLGHSFGPSSYCFHTDGIIHTRFSKSSQLKRCLNTRCATGRLEIQVYRTWIACPLDGTAGNVTVDAANFKGEVMCPTAETICGPAATLAPLTPAPTTANGTIIATKIPENLGVAAITAKLTIVGTTFESFFASPEEKILLSNSVARDVASILGVDPENIKIVSLEVGSLIVTFSIISNSQTRLLTSENVDSALKSQVNKGAVKLANTAALYATVSSETLFISDAGVEEVVEESVCGTSIDADKCILVISVVVAFVFLVMVIGLSWFLCCKDIYDGRPPKAPVKKVA